VFVSSDCSVKQTAVWLFHTARKTRGKTLHWLFLSVSISLISIRWVESCETRL